MAEFLEGGNLDSLLRNKPHELTDEVITKIARGICAGMIHLTSEGIVHRDLAARNILLAPNYVPKVAGKHIVFIPQRLLMLKNLSDFGMSRFGHPNETNTTNNVVGPVRWYCFVSRDLCELLTRTAGWHQRAFQRENSHKRFPKDLNVFL